MTWPLVALVVAVCGVMVLGFLATGLLMPHASSRRKNAVSAVALLAVAAPAMVALASAAR